MNQRREVESVSPSTPGYSSETSLAQAKIYDHLTPRLGHPIFYQKQTETQDSASISGVLGEKWPNSYSLDPRIYESRVIKLLKSIEDLSRLTNSLDRT